MVALAALPSIGAIALKYLPAATALGGAMPGLRRGNIAEAALGAGLGAASSYGMAGPIGGLTTRAVRMAGGMGAQNVLGTLAGQVGGLGAQKAVMGALTPQVLGNVAKAAIPLGAAGAMYGVSGGLANVGSNAASRAGGAVVGGLNQTGLGPMGDPLSGLPPGMSARMLGPDGNWWYQADPGGVPAGDRMGRVLGAQTDANVLNTIGNTLYGQTERTAKAELTRQAAAAQLKANIDMAKEMSLNSQVAGLNIAQNAGQNMGQAMSNRSMFRYF